jgi:PAS domain S-box-containing protein
MKVSLDNLTKAGFGLALAILAGIGAISYRSVTGFVETTHAIERSHAVIEGLEDLTTEVTDVESGARGFVMAGQDLYLDPYHAALRDLVQTRADLRRLTAGDPESQTLLAVIEPRVAENLAWHQQMIELRRLKGSEAVIPLASTGRGHQLMDRVREAINQMEDREKGLLKQRTVQERSRAVWSIQTSVVGTLLGFSMLLLVYLHLNREVAGRRRSEENLIQSNRLYAVLSHVGEASVRIRDREELFREVCRVAVEDGGFRMCWAGLVGAAGQVLPAARYGTAEGTLATLRMCVAGDPEEPGPVEDELHEGRHVVANDLATDQRLPWRDEALRSGYRSAAIFPLMVEGRLFGVFAVYGSVTGLFAGETTRMLDEAAANLSLTLERREQEARRRQAEEALRESEARFRQMAESVEEMFWISDRGLSQLLYVSPAYEQIWGRTCQSLYQDPKSFIEGVHPEDRERVAGEIERAQAAGNWDREYRILRPDGSIRWVWDRAFPIRDSSGEIHRCVGISQDITARKQVELELQTRAAQQKAVAQLSQYALEGEDLDTFLDATVRVTARVLDVELCKMLELLPDGSGLRMRAGVGWKEGLVGHAVVAAGQDSQAGYTLLSNAPVIVEDLRTESRFTGPPLLREHGVVSGISVVIGDPQRPLGVLGAHSTRRRAFTEDDVHFLRAISSTLAASIERRRAEEGLRLSEARFRSMFEQAGAGMAMTSASGAFLQVNPALCAFLGYSEAELLKLTTFDITHPEDLPQTRKFFDEAITGRRRLVDLEKRYLRKDGAVVWAQVSGAWLFGDGARPIHALVLMQDITTRKRAEDEILRLNQDLERRVADRTAELAALNRQLEERNREVERANRMKSEFLARMSHELRTPMNAIIGFSDLLAEESDGALGDTYKGYVARIRQGARHLLDLINDVLDLSKIEAGRIELSPEDISASAALAEVLSVIRPLAEAKKLEVRSELPAEVWVRADRTCLKQILYNLLSNAVKFTPEGGRVWVEATVEDGRVSISVSDTGVGIPAPEHAAIFEEFHQVRPGAGGAREGTGLGLAITKRLVELHGGTIRVTSEPEKGSRFTFAVPAAMDGAEAVRLGGE